MNLKARSRARAAVITRSATMVTGGSSRTATPLNRKEPPHTIERTASSAQSDAVMFF